MAQYTKVFADTYPGGWKSKPDISTPYTTAVKNNEDATFRAIEDYLYNNPIGDISQASIGDLSDVTIVAADKVQGNVLTYDAVSEKIVLAEPSGGGGKSYSTTEKLVGKDENGNDIYAKTYIEDLDPLEEVTGDTFSIINTAHRILCLEAYAYFDITGSNKFQMHPLPFVYGYPDDGAFVFSKFGDISVEYGYSSVSVPTIAWEAYYYDSDNDSYTAPVKIRVTAYYIKETT